MASLIAKIESPLSVKELLFKLIVKGLILIVAGIKLPKVTSSLPIGASLVPCAIISG